MSISYGFFVGIMLFVGVMWAIQYNFLLRRVRLSEFRSRVLLRKLRERQKSEVEESGTNKAGR